MGGSIPSVGRTISWGGSHARESELSTSVHLSLLLDWGHTVTSSSRCDFHTRMDCVSLNCEPRQTLSPSSCFCRGVFFFLSQQQGERLNHHLQSQWAQSNGGPCHPSKADFWPHIHMSTHEYVITCTHGQALAHRWKYLQTILKSIHHFTFPPTALTFFRIPWTKR